LGRRDGEGVREEQETVEPEINLAALDEADVVSMERRAVGERFLR
jgi:hypothetical protein